MAIENISSVNCGGVEMSVKGDTVIISGNIQHQKPEEFMEPFFQSVHDAIIAGGIHDIIADITELKFLNSSGIREFVEWVMKVEQLENNQKYKIHFKCSLQYNWQESSIETLLKLNPGFITKESISN